MLLRCNLRNTIHSARSQNVDTQYEWQVCTYCGLNSATSLFYNKTRSTINSTANSAYPDKPLGPTLELGGDIDPYGIYRQITSKGSMYIWVIIIIIIPGQCLWCCHHAVAALREFTLVHAMSAARRQVAADLWTKPIGLNHKPACRLPVNYTHQLTTQICKITRNFEKIRTKWV